MIRKRTCSFGDVLYPQCKSHIGEKEVNLGVNKDENMKVIYAKTLDKLFKASQMKTSNGFLSKNTQRLVVTECDHYKQMFLNSNCQLQTQGNVKNVVSQSLCGVCTRASCINRECSFCEKELCENCILTCMKCKQHFCSFCIFTVYERNEEFSICRWCY